MGNKFVFFNKLSIVFIGIGLSGERFKGFRGFKFQGVLNRIFGFYERGDEIWERGGNGY